MKKKTKPTSVRFDSDLLEELDQRCSKVGCSRNDFIKNSVEFIINDSSDFDFGGDEEESEEEPRATSEGKIIGIVPSEPIVKEIFHGTIKDDNGNVIGTF